MPAFDGTPVDEPWFASVLKGGRVAVPDLLKPVTVLPVSRGVIDIRSGSIRIAKAHDFARGSVPVDADIPEGDWHVHSLIVADNEGGELGALAEVVTWAVDHDGTPVSWVRATAGGHHPRFRGDNVVIGDADLLLTLGTGAAARAFPRLPAGATEEETSRLRAWRREDAAATGPLLPDSTVRAYRAPDTWRFPVDMADRLGLSGLWLGLDRGGRVSIVVVDQLSIFWGCNSRRMPASTNPWNDGSALQSATLATGESGLEAESADLGRLFGPWNDEDTSAVHRIGDLHLEGELCATTPVVPASTGDVSFRHRATELPLHVPRGRYPCFVLGLNAPDAVLLRFGDARPSRWMRCVAMSLGLTRGGSYLLADGRTLESTSADASLHGALTDAWRWAGVDLVTNHGRAVALVNTSTGSMEPDAWCIGLDDRGRVLALVVVQEIESVYALRPASEDADVLASLEALRHFEMPPKYREEYDEDWRQLRSLMGQSGGGSGTELRVHLHFMHAKYRFRS